MHPNIITAIQRAASLMRRDNLASIVLRRGYEELPSQDVRVEQVGSGQQKESDGASERRSDVILHGDTSFDVQIDDRFTYQGYLYRVTFVHTNQQAFILADAEVVE